VCPCLFELTSKRRVGRRLARRDHRSNIKLRTGQLILRSQALPGLEHLTNLIGILPRHPASLLRKWIGRCACSVDSLQRADELSTERGLAVGFDLQLQELTFGSVADFAKT